MQPLSCLYLNLDMELVYAAVMQMSTNTLYVTEFIPKRAANVNYPDSVSYYVKRIAASVVLEELA
jgi:hypothetical protein